MPNTPNTPANPNPSPRAGAHVRKHVAKHLAKRFNVPLPAAEHSHVCTDHCAPSEDGKCRLEGKTFRYAPFKAPKDHVILSVEHLPDGGRAIVDMHVDDLAEHLSHHADAPLTFASAKAALEAKHAATGADTGLLPFLDRLHADGILP